MEDREAWHAAVHGVTKKQTQLNDWTSVLRPIRIEAFQTIYTRGWQDNVCGPDLAQHLLKFYWHTTTSMCLGTGYGCFQATTVKFSSSTETIAHSRNTYYLSFSEKVC